MKFTKQLISKSVLFSTHKCSFSSFGIKKPLGAVSVIVRFKVVVDLILNSSNCCFNFEKKLYLLFHILHKWNIIYRKALVIIGNCWMMILPHLDCLHSYLYPHHCCYYHNTSVTVTPGRIQLSVYRNNLYRMLN